MTSNQRFPLAPVAGRTLLSDLPAGERPAQRLREAGASYLSSVELLALVVDTVDALDLARDVLAFCGDLHRLARLTAVELVQVPGVNEALAGRIQAAAELGRRLADPPTDEAPLVTCPVDVVRHLSDMRHLNQEQMRVVLLNGSQRVISIETVATGSPFSLQLRLADVLRPAIVARARSIVLAHNHPSGNLEPSNEDINTTRSCWNLAREMGINLLDHLIISNHGYTSLAERGIISSEYHPNDGAQELYDGR